MALLHITADLREVVKALNRIGDILERAFPPIAIPVPTEPRGRDTLIRKDPEKLWQKERDLEQQRSQG